MQKKIVKVLGIPFFYTTMHTFIETLKKHDVQGDKVFVVTGNPEIVMHAQEDEEYKRIINRADYVTADGIGVIKGAQLLGTPLPERVAGFDILTNLLKYSNENRKRIYMVGSTPENIEKAVENVKKMYPHLIIVGYHHGYFTEDKAIVNDIVEKSPDFVFVGLGFPRQEKWIQRILPKFKKGIFMGVGGSFDVFAGTVKRAPLVWQKLNLEWFYRLIMQPTRFRRMLVLPKFMMKVIQNKSEQKKVA